jgi:hypothetical protein
VATSVAGQQVLAVPISGNITQVGADLPGQVRILRLLPDGVSALAVTQSGARMSLMQLRVERQSTGTRLLSGSRPLASGWSAITALSIEGADTLLVAGELNGVLGLYRMDADGFGRTAVSLEGLPTNRITTVASSSATPAVWVVAAAGHLYRRGALASAPWSRVGSATGIPGFAG